MIPLLFHIQFYYNPVLCSSSLLSAYTSLCPPSGKYVEIRFGSTDGALLGAAVRTYLLERSRVVHVNGPERSYHIFYHV